MATSVTSAAKNACTTSQEISSLRDKTIENTKKLSIRLMDDISQFNAKLNELGDESDALKWAKVIEISKYQELGRQWVKVIGEFRIISSDFEGLSNFLNAPPPEVNELIGSFMSAEKSYKNALQHQLEGLMNNFDIQRKGNSWGVEKITAQAVRHIPFTQKNPREIERTAEAIFNSKEPEAAKAEDQGEPSSTSEPDASDEAS